MTGRGNLSSLPPSLLSTLFTWRRYQLTVAVLIIIISIIIIVVVVLIINITINVIEFLQYAYYLKGRQTFRTLTFS